MERGDTVSSDYMNRDNLRGWLSTLTPWRDGHPDEVPDADVEALQSLLFDVLAHERGEEL